MMNLYLKLTLIVLGAVLGFFLSSIAERIAEYKCSQKEMALTKDRRFTAITLKLSLLVFTAAGWFAAAELTENIIIAVLLALLFSSSILIAIIDIRIRLIPNELVLLMLVLGAGLRVSTASYLSLLTSIVCMAALMVMFTAVAGFVGFDKIGAGDVKLAGAMGFALGYPGVVASLVVMSAGFFAFSLIGLLIKRLSMKTMLPFAPFMMSGMAFALLYTAG